MFEDLVSSLLSKYLGDYLEGLSKQDLKLSLWKGDVELKNLRVKTEALDFLNLPIQVKEGFVGCLTLKIPWKHLGSENTKIHIDDVYVIACPQSELKYNEEEEKEKAQQRKREQLLAIEENGIRMDAELNAKENNSAVAKLVAKIIDNLQISVNRVHIRFEDHSSIPGHHFAAGVILEKLHLHTPSSENKDEPEILIPGVMRKKVRISRFGVYWDFDEGSRIRTKSAETIQQEMRYAFAAISELPAGKEGLYPRHWIIEPISLSLSVKADTRKTEIRKPSYQDAIVTVMNELKWSDKIDETKRIIHAYKHVRKDEVRGRTAEEEWVLMKEYLDKKHPNIYVDEAMEMARRFCYRCWDISNTPSPILEVSGEMTKILIQLEQKQYRDILGFVSALNTQTLRAKYKQFRPQKETAEQNPRAWWKFAIKSVMWENERRRTDRGWKQVIQFKQERAEYIELYKRKNGMKPSLKKDPKGLAQLQKLEEKLSLENILLFRKIALQEMEEQEKLKAKKKEREKKERREKNVFLKMFKKNKKKDDDSSDEEEVDLNEVWNDDKRQELFAEFDINPDEVSPWEGGRPTDIQLSIQFKLNQVGVSLLNSGSKVMLCSLDGLSTQVIKRKSYLQVFAGVSNMRIEDGSKRCEKWPNVVYAEKDAISERHKIDVFLPSCLVESDDLPFLQAAIEIPSMTKDVDMSIKARTLPLCLVGNMAFIMDLASFVVPELSKLNFTALSASATSLYSQLSSTKKLKLKASKEILTHKNMGLDVLVGALHVILPEDIDKDVTKTQCMVLRLGDISVKSDPRRVSVDEKITESNIYDTIDIQLHRINAIFTNYEKHWARQEVQDKQNLHVINDFNCNAQVGLSIAPSQTDFATTKVVAKADRVSVSLTKQKYLALMKFATAFSSNVSDIIADSDVDFSSLTAQAKEAVSNTLAERNEEEKKNEEVAVVNKEEVREEKNQASEYSDEELRLLQQNRTLSISAVLDGVSVLIEEVSARNEHTKIACANVSGLRIGVEQRTFDMNVNVSLNCIEVVDCLQSASTGHTEYLVASKPINFKGEVEEEKTKDLFKITVGIVQQESPDYASSESDVDVSVEFGALSVLAYRPTVYHLLKFIAPETEEEKKEEEVRRQKRRRSSSTSSVASYLSAIIEKETVSIQSRAADLIKSKSNSIARVEQAKPVPSNWTRKQVKVGVDIQAMAVYLRADSGKGLLFGNIEGIRIGVAVCAATVSVEGSLTNVALRDVSPGAGKFPHILEIVDRAEDEKFVDFAITLFSDARYPLYPGYVMSVKGVVRSPSLCLRMRIVDELMRYVLAGPIADGLKLLETPKSETPVEQVETPHFAMETIDEIDEEESESEEEGVVGKSIRDSVLLLGKSYLIPTKEKDAKLPFVLPLIDLTLNTIRVSVPAASVSEEIASFELGSITIQNTPPVQKEEDGHIIVDTRSLKETLNTVRVSVTNMKASTTITSAAGTHNLALLGGINLGVTAVVANVIEVNARITKMALAVNEEQMQFAMKIMKGNFAEKAVLIEDELPSENAEKKEQRSHAEPRKPEPTPVADTKSKRASRNLNRLSITPTAVPEKKEEIEFGKHIRGQFCFDGICVELLSGCEGYDAVQSGKEIYDSVGTLANSISCVDIGVVDCLVQLQNKDITAGVSLSHIHIRDTRVNTNIHPAYRIPFAFGAQGKPAVSALVSLVSSDIHEFQELKEFWNGEQQAVQEIKASVNIGKLQIIPTPWLFDILKIVEGLSEKVLGDEKKEEKKAEVDDKESVTVSTVDESTSVHAEEKKTEKTFGPQITADICIEDPSVFIVENPAKEDSSSFLLSLSMSGHASISPLMNIDASLGIESIRGCRCHPLDTSIPSPGLTDAITPFDINLNLHTAETMKKIQGTVMTNHDVEIRLGLLDAKLFTNFFINLIPKEVKEQMKEQKEQTEEKEKTEENKTEEKKVEMDLSLKAIMNSITITIVNDTKDFELPVMQLVIGDVSASVDRNMDKMTIDCTLSVAADYYNGDYTVWEPVIEKWEIQALIEQESRDRVIQRLTALQAAGSNNENSLLRVNISTATMLNCNITAAFIKTALQSVNAFLDCKDTTQKIGDSFYIGIRNSTGIPIDYTVERDNGINELVQRQLSQKIEKTMESAFFSGLAAVMTSQGLTTCWVALYYTSPHIRVFNAIPTFDELKPIAWADTITLLEENRGIFSEVCTFNSEFLNLGEHVVIVENDDEKALWRKAIETAMTGVSPEEKRIQSMIIEHSSSVATVSSVFPTTLPAHPSLTLKYYKKPYKKIAPRSLLLSMDGYPSFPYMVDRSDCQYVVMKAEGLPQHTLFIESVIDKGMKVINISSSVSVENRTAQDILAGFGKWVSDDDISYAEFSSSVLAAKDTMWSSCVEVNSGLFLGISEATCCLSVEDVCEKGYYGLVNIGEEQSPVYVNITCEKRMIHNIDNPTETKPVYKIVVSNVVLFENLLPCSIDYQVINKTEMKIVDGSLKEGGSVSFSQCRFTKEDNYRISIRLTGDNYAFSAYTASIDLFSTTGTVKLIDRNHFRNLNLSYTASRDSNGLYTVQLYCDYWIMNKTGDSLIVRDSKDRDFEFTVPSNPLVLKNLSETICNQEELLLPTLFSVKKKDKNDTAVISLPGYGVFSEAFSINTLGMTGTVTVASKDSKQSEKVFGVSISRAPGVFARSCVITITPLYIVVNQVGLPVSLRQQNCETAVEIPAKQYSSFHWSNQSSNHKVQIHLDTLDYDWSQSFELVPSHLSLQMIKNHNQGNQYDCWDREVLEDPVDAPYSIVQIDITMISSQCYVFIKKMDPSYMPFCISNNTALDCITISQEHSSWNYALTVHPLSSRLWTLPVVTSTPIINVYCKKLGTLSEKNDYSMKMSLDVTKPGKLGDFTMKEPNRTISVSLEMQKSMRVLVFDEVKTKKFSLLNKKSTQNRVKYLQERRVNLMDLSSATMDRIEDHMNSIIAYINEQERCGSGLPPSARSTFLQIRNAYDTDLCCDRTMRVKVYFKVHGSEYETGSNRGHLNYFGAYKIMNEVNEVEMRMEAKNDLQMTTTGYGVLKLSEYCEQDRLYDLVVPFYQENGKKLLGYCNVRFVNCRDEHIAEASFRKEELYEEKNLIENVIQRIHTEAYIEKRFSKNPSLKDSIASQHVIRATHSGVYKSYSSQLSQSSNEGSVKSLSSSSSSMLTSTMSINQLNVFNEEEGTEDVERNMNYCVMLNQLMKIPLPQEEVTGIYATARIGQTTLRIPASTQVGPDPEQYPDVTDVTDELVYEAASANLGCDFRKEGNTMVVCSVVKEGPADKIGVRVGHILASIDGGDVPPSVDELRSFLESSDTVTLGFVTSPIKDFSAVLFCQQFIFPAGVTVNETTMQLSVYKETDDEDKLLVSADIPINRENDGTYDIRLSHLFSACLKSHWSSFNPEEELVSASLTLNFKGLGISLVDSKPTELLYLSVNDLRADVSLFESGKKTAEVKLKSFQIDNQIVGCRYPVFFGSPSSDRDWFHASAILLPHPSILYIEYFSLLIQEMKVNCDSRILMNLLQFISAIPLDLLQFTEKDPLSKLNDYPEFIKPMLIPDSSINSMSIFAEELELQPLLLTLTNKMDPSYPITGSILPSIPFLIPVQALIDTAGTLIGNIDNAQIKLNSFSADNLYMTQRDLISRLTLHYVKQFMGQVYKIIGSFNFLGNPVGLAENLTSGVKAFFYEPMQGLVKSPKEFVGGIGRGTKALLMNTAFGVLNTVSKITSTLADGLATLTMSEEYKNDRAAGKGGIAYGVKEGITGVYKDTMNGAKKAGFVGAIAGTGKGLLNLVVKPVVGVVDQTTKLFDNAKGITQIEKHLQRSREPRYIYKDHCLTSFSQYLAYGQSLMNESKTNTLIPTGEEYFVHVGIDENTVILIGNSRFIWYNRSDKKVTQVVKYKHLVSIDQKQRSVQFICDNNTRITAILSESVACVIPALQNRIVHMKYQAVTNLVVRLLMAMNQPVSQEDRLLAEMEPISVGGPTLVESVSSRDLHESSEKMNETPLSVSTASENVYDYKITGAEVVTYHQGVEYSKNILKGGNSYTEYEIVVEASENHRKWVVYRRYTNFKDLMDDLKKANPMKAKKLKLPGKQLKLIQSKSMLEKRVSELSSFVESVVNEEDFLENECVIDFLKKDCVRIEEM